MDILRRYRASDFEVLYEIDRECFPKGIAYGRAELKIYLGLAGAHCLLAEIKNEIAGFILTDRSGELGHVITLDVLEAYRRKRIASLLLGAAENHAASHGVSRMCLETATTNKPAIAFWRAHGYREIGTAKNYYGRGLDAFVMDKKLGDATELAPG